MEDEEADDDIMCWKCWGEGGWHDCGKGPCNCKYPMENTTCDICQGEGILN